ncbi:MAG: lipocalin family protein [Halopseudomonas sp.]|uniref:lipocalin family protein n=1 Tax=Halopseudomonas sp. TaxID=2901191 RepID=UPI003003A0CB
MTYLRQTGLLLAVSLVGGCVQLPEGVTPVQPFEAERYLGTWYEVARLDHSFERGLSGVTANYSLRDDGGIKVINRGCNAEKGEWEEAEGKAYFAETPNQGFLKVSFFGPFYGTYAVFGLDQQDYQYSFVSGPNTDYLWLLSRSPQPDQAVKDEFVRRAEALGFPTSELIWVTHPANACGSGETKS